MDPHDELGVGQDASLVDIKQAYRRLAAKWHPDRNTEPQAVMRMQRINQAYRRLCEWYAESPADPVEGAAADRTPPPHADTARHEPPRKAKTKKAWWERDWGYARWEPDGQAMPQTIQHGASITLEAAAFGCLHHVKGLITDLCGDCGGTGRWVSPRSTCSVCDGEGHLPGKKRPCNHCGGDCRDRKACETCSGSGLQDKPRSYHFEVRIPAGIRSGQTVLLREQGQRDGERRGDIELTVEVQPHPMFSWRPDHELACEVPVDVFTAMAQSTVEVPTLDGHLVNISLADGAQQALAGLGFPKRDGSRGALWVSFKTVTPNRYTAAQKALLQKLSDSVKQAGSDCPELAAWQRKLRPGPGSRQS